MTGNVEPIKEDPAFVEEYVWCVNGSGYVTTQHGRLTLSFQNELTLAFHNELTLSFHNEL